MQSTGGRGLIETLAAGFGALHRQVALFLIPVGVDAFLWLGPKLSLGPLVGPAPEAATTGGDLLATLGQMNILGLLAFQVPSVIGLAVVKTSPAPPGEVLGSWADALSVVPLMAALGMAVACLYFGVMAVLVREEGRPSPGALAMRVAVYWVRFTGLLLLVALAAALLSPVAALVLSFVGQVSPPLAGALIAVPIFFATFYLFFIEDALFVSQVGPLRAIGYGTLVVQRFFWRALGLFLLVNLIVLGMNFLWGRIAEHPAGLAAAILANAYVYTGLTAAGMVFYRDRILSLREEPQAG